MAVQQVVEVETASKVKTLAYLWEGENPLALGDWVRVPPNWYKNNPQVLKVVRLTSDYVGPLAIIMEKINCTCDEDGQVFCYYHPNKNEKF